MARENITQYSATASDNRDIEGINVDEGCPVRGINNAIRTLMAHLKDFDVGNTTLTSPSVMTLKVVNIQLGESGWIISADADGILFNKDGVTQAKLLNDGEFRAGDITGVVNFN